MSTRNDPQRDARSGAAQLGREREYAPRPTSPFRTCRSACSGRRRRGAPTHWRRDWRSDSRSSEIGRARPSRWITCSAARRRNRLDVEPVDGARPCRTRRSCGSGSAGCLRQTARCRPRLLVPSADVDTCTFRPRSATTPTSTHRSLTRRNVGKLFRPGQSAAAELQVRAHRLSRPRVVDRRQRHAGAAAVRSDRRRSDELPVFGPSERLDYEVEIGCLCGPGNALGQPIPIDDAENHVFGLCLVNDWSARDIQAWEYQPLGPFLAKSFATTVSPWVVTLEALAPFRSPAFARPPDDPAPLPLSLVAGNEASGGFDVTVEVCCASAEMRRAALAPMRISRSVVREMYWTLGADGGAPHEQRLQSAAWRSHRQRHGVGIDPGRAAAVCSK